MAGFSFIEAVEVLSFAVSTRGICDRFDFILFRIYIYSSNLYCLSRCQTLLRKK